MSSQRKAAAFGRSNKIRRSITNQIISEDEYQRLAPEDRMPSDEESDTEQQLPGSFVQSRSASRNRSMAPPNKPKGGSPQVAFMDTTTSNAIMDTLKLLTDKVAALETDRARGNTRSVFPSAPFEHSQARRSYSPTAPQASQASASSAPGNFGKSRSSKVPDPRTFTMDDDKVSYEEWETEVMAKLAINQDHFESEEAKMHLVYRATGGKARDYIQGRYKFSSTNRFQTHQEILAYLRNIAISPYVKEDARRDYNRLMMRTTDTFHDFRAKFHRLADEAEVPSDQLIADLYYKLTTELQKSLIVPKREVTDLDTFCDIAVGVNTDLRRLHARETKLRSTAVTGTQHNKMAVGASARAFPSSSQTPVLSGARQSTPTTLVAKPTDKCYNCGGTGHFAQNCMKPKVHKSINLSELEEVLDEQSEEDVESGKEDA